MISRTSRAAPAEAIYADSTERVVCAETAFTADTRSELPVSDVAPNVTREELEGRLLELDLDSSSRTTPYIHSLTQIHTTTTNQLTKEKATANATAAWLVDVLWVLNPSAAPSWMAAPLSRMEVAA